MIPVLSSDSLGQSCQFCVSFDNHIISCLPLCLRSINWEIYVVYIYDMDLTMLIGYETCSKENMTCYYVQYLCFDYVGLFVLFLLFVFLKQ